MKKIQPLTDEEQRLFNLLVNKYGILPSVEQTSEILQKSKATLYRERKHGTGVKYIQDGKNSTVRYPLHEIVRYMCSTKDR